MIQAKHVERPIIVSTLVLHAIRMLIMSSPCLTLPHCVRSTQVSPHTSVA